MARTKTTTTKSAKFRFDNFSKGWIHNQPHLVSLDGFSAVNNFVVYKKAPEKVRGWERLELNLPEVEALVEAPPIEYPLVGPYVQSIFSYIKFEEENIKLGTFALDTLPFFGIDDEFDYDIDFNVPPATEDGVVVANSYGLVYTCEKTCNLVSHETTIGENPLKGGLAFKVKNGSTKDNATLYGMIYDPFTSQLVFGRWIDASVQTYDFIMGTISPVSYPIGTKLRVTEVTANTFRFYVDDVQVEEITDTGVMVEGGGGACFGMVKLQH